MEVVRLRQMLRPEQRPILDSAQEPGLTIVSAVPGAGKTQVEASVFLTEIFSSRTQINLLSFTKAAVQTANERIRELNILIGGSSYDLSDRAFSKTLHAYALRWFSDHGQRIKVADDVQARTVAALKARMEAHRFDKCANAARVLTTHKPESHAELWTVMQAHVANGNQTHPDGFAKGLAHGALKLRKARNHNKKYRDLDDEACGRELCAHMGDKMGELSALGYESMVKSAGPEGKRLDPVESVAKECARYRADKILADEAFEPVHPAGYIATVVSATLAKDGMHDHLSYLREFVVSGGTFGGEGTLVIIDEAQNTPKLLRRALMASLSDNARVVLAGDPSQAICSFAGSEYKAMQALADEAAASGVPCRAFRLTVNQRSTRPIVRVAECVLPMQDRVERGHIDGTRDGTPVQYCFFRVDRDPFNERSDERYAQAMRQGMLNEYKRVLNEVDVRLRGSADCLKPGNIAILASRNFGYDHMLYRCVNRYMHIHGLPPARIKNRAPLNTVARLIAVLKAAIGLEFFEEKAADESPDEANAQIGAWLDFMNALREARFSDDKMTQLMGTLMSGNTKTTCEEAFLGNVPGATNAATHIGIAYDAAHAADGEDDLWEAPAPSKKPDQKKKNIQKEAMRVATILPQLRKQVEAALARQDVSGVKFTMPDLSVSGTAKARNEKLVLNTKNIEEMDAGLPETHAPLGQVARAIVVHVLKDMREEPYDSLHLFLCSFDNETKDTTSLEELVQVIKTLELRTLQEASSKSLMFSTIHGFQGDERHMVILTGANKSLTSGWMDVAEMNKLSHLHDAGCEARLTNNPKDCKDGACVEFRARYKERLRQLADERQRVVHVAISRAREELLITGHGTEGSLPMLFAGVTANGHLVSSNNLENRPEVRQLFEFFLGAGHKTERSVKSSTSISKYFKKV